MNEDVKHIYLSWLIGDYKIEQKWAGNNFNLVWRPRKKVKFLKVEVQHFGISDDKIVFKYIWGS